MTTTGKEDVLRSAAELKVKFVHLQFTDILGTLKNVAVPVEQLEKALDGQVLFDGSSIEGFVRIEESDMLLRPDPATFAVFPWRHDGEGVTARMLCDIHSPDGEPFAGCPRLALKRVLAEAAQMGYTVMCGPEAEFFLFQRDENGRPIPRTHDQGGYFDLLPLDRGEDARRDMVLALQRMGFEVEAAHHEVAPAQHEIDFRYTDALRTADNVATFKFVVRIIALTHNLHATFMPKPMFGVAGSGMHTHQSLFSGGANAFFDPGAPHGLSATAMHYLAGLMQHARGFTAVSNPLVNSYKRLVTGFEAPVYIAWSERNRSPFIRVPARRGPGTRLELRSPDPSCNPYLALAATISAGLDGIKRRLQPPPPTKRNIYTMTPEERANAGIRTLPVTLREALDELSRDEVITAALGPHIVGRFLEAKGIEWEMYRTQVHQWEIDKYLASF